MDLFNPGAILDIVVGRLGPCRGPDWTGRWAVWDIAVDRFGHNKKLSAVLVRVILAHGRI